MECIVSPYFSASEDTGMPMYEAILKTENPTT
jgi:hypothetical protein